MHWSRWTGGYGKHGLIAGRARGTGHLRGCDEGCFTLGRVTIVLSRVTNFGVNAATYYERLHIIGGKHVAHYWHWSQRQDSFRDSASALSQASDQPVPEGVRCGDRLVGVVCWQPSDSSAIWSAAAGSRRAAIRPGRRGSPERVRS